MNNTTLQISTVKAAPALAGMLAQTYFCPPVEEDTPVAPGGIGFPPSAGPYYVEYDTGSVVTLARNPYYTEGQKPGFERIVFSSGKTLAACRQAVAKNKSDLCLDALPKTSGASTAANLVSSSSLNKTIGCFSTNAVLGVDLVGLCRR